MIEIKPAYREVHWRHRDMWVNCNSFLNIPQNLAGAPRSVKLSGCHWLRTASRASAQSKTLLSHVLAAKEGYTPLPKNPTLLKSLQRAEENNTPEEKNLRVKEDTQPSQLYTGMSQEEMLDLEPVISQPRANNIDRATGVVVSVVKHWSPTRRLQHLSE